tara:strand:+ start:5588 stop:8170 length:2583 start_codon:yes stop_codon:yes gene_type:complete
MAELKRVLFDRPEQGDVSQYNFDSNETNFIYENTISIPVNNDQFQNKDLITKIVGHDVNEDIIERNLKFQGDPSIKIDNIYISNTGVGGTVKNNQVAVYLFSQAAYGADPTKDGYSTLKSKLADNTNDWLIYSEGFGHKSEGSDIGNLDKLEGVEIVSNFSTDSTQIGFGDIPGRTLSIDDSVDNSTYIPSKIKAFELSDILDVGTNNDGLLTSLFNQEQSNPIYIVVYMRGDKKVAWPIKTDDRRRKYSIFKISNEDLFEKTGTTFAGTNYTVNFDKSTKTRTGEGGGGATQAAWKVSSLTLSINTSAGTDNNFSDVSAYSDTLPQVLPPTKVNENIFQTFDWLGLLNPNSQLDNQQDAEIPPTDETNRAINRHPDYFPFTTFGFKSITQNQLGTNYVDLQTYHDDFDSIMKASAPMNVTFDISIKDINNDEIEIYSETSKREYYYFVIDWNDTEDKFKTIDDFLNSKPENQIDYLGLQNQNLYKVRKIPGTGFNISSDYLATLPFPIYRQEFDITDVNDNFIQPVGGTNYFINTGELGGTDINAWVDVGRPDIAQYMLDNNLDQVYYPGPPGDDTEFQIPLAAEGVVTNPPSHFYNPSSEVDFSEITNRLNNIYTTPGIKNLKIIIFDVFKGDGSESSPLFEVGRWKLITSRFFLDIAPNQYPDFGDVGGSDFTTLPWPFTTPIIGGVDENSKYKKSVQNTLAGGKIGQFDLIDEKFLVNDKNNLDMGKSVKLMDLEQVRYFDTSYDLDRLLGVERFNLLNEDGSIFWDGEINKYSEETSVGQIFISDNQDVDLKRSCQIELNTGELTGKSIIDTSGNANKGLLIGDYKIKKVRKGQSMRRDSFIKVPKKTGNTKGAL